jgi:hypothetical protein
MKKIMKLPTVQAQRAICLNFLVAFGPENRSVTLGLHATLWDAKASL